MARAVVVGSSNTDMVVRSPRLPEPGETVLGGDFLMAAGGKGANQAVAARRAGAEVALVAAVGEDVFGKSSVHGFCDEGIDVSHVVTLPGVASGVALILLDEAGEKHFTVRRSKIEVRRAAGHELLSGIVAQHLGQRFVAVQDGPVQRGAVHAGPIVFEQ